MTEPTTTLSFRTAQPDDWRQIWPIFSAVVATGDTYAYPPDVSAAAAAAAWMPDEDSGRTTYVAELDGGIVATAYVKPNGPGLSSHVANAGWMVAPDAAGHGIGRRFGEWVIDQAVHRGFTRSSTPSSHPTSERWRSGSRWGSRSSARCPKHSTMRPGGSPTSTSCSGGSETAAGLSRLPGAP